LYKTSGATFYYLQIKIGLDILKFRVISYIGWCCGSLVLIFINQFLVINLEKLQVLLRRSGVHVVGSLGHILLCDPNELK
jgi:hypothetical protein